MKIEFNIYTGAVIEPPQLYSDGCPIPRSETWHRERAEEKRDYQEKFWATLND